MNYNQAIKKNAENYQKFIEMVNIERLRLGLETVTLGLDFDIITKANKYKETNTDEQSSRQSSG